MARVLAEDAGRATGVGRHPRQIRYSETETFSAPEDASVRPRDASPTLVHSSRISFFHAVHSLKRYSLLCLPLLHHQHTSLSVHLHFSLRKSAVVAYPLRSWKHLAATGLGAPQSWGLIPGLDFGADSLKTLLQAFLSVSSRHRRVTRPVVERPRKAKLVRVAIRRSVASTSLYSAAALAYRSASSLPATPQWPGTHLTEMILPCPGPAR